MSYLTVAEVAERLKVYPGTVKRWLRDGKLAGVSLGDRAGWRIAEEDLARFLHQQSNVAQVEREDRQEGKTAAWLDQAAAENPSPARTGRTH